MRRVNFLFRKAPYGSVNDVEGFRLCTAFTAMEIETNAIFISDGVFATMNGGNPEHIGLPSLVGAYKMLPSLNVKLYILKEALEERGISKNDLIETEYKIINRTELAELILQSDFTISF